MANVLPREKRIAVLHALVNANSERSAADLANVNARTVARLAVDIARARVAFWTPERHRLELTNAAALRTAEKREKEAAVQGQTTIFDLLSR